MSSDIPPHLLAQGVKQLFPEAQVTIWPLIEDGFYHDFGYKRPFTEFFRNQGEIYKAEIIASIPEKEDISLYGQGDWVDLCRGPHVQTMHDGEHT